MFKNIKFKTTNFQFTFIYSIFHCTILNFFIWKSIHNLVNIETVRDVYFFFVLLIGLNLLYFLIFQIFFIIPKLVKFFAILFLIISSICSYFIFSYNIVIDRGMIENAFMTDINETIGLLSLGMIVYMFFFCIVPIFLILRTKIIHIGYIKKVAILITTFIISIAIILPNYVQIASFFRKNHSLGGKVVPSNYISASISCIKKQRRLKNLKTEIDLNAKIEKKNDILVILVVGETARRANFSLYGYERETNPLLAKLDIERVDNATSCGTSTNESLPCIFSPESRVCFENNKKESLLNTLLRLNLKSYWLENNFGGCYGICDKVHVSRFNGEPDGQMLPEFDKILHKVAKEKDQQMIVLHQNGSHGPLYKDRFEAGFDKFVPICKTAEVAKCTKDQLVNTYDNTILYTDYFLAEVIKKIETTSKPTILIYASDHGESLGENGFFLHGFPYSIAPKEQKEIPFLIYTSKSYKAKHGSIKSCISKLKNPSHDNIYHTIAGLLTLQTKFYSENLDILKNCD